MNDSNRLQPARPHSLRQLHEFIDAELPVAEQQAVLAHLARCPHCLTEIEVTTRVSARVRRSATETGSAQLRVQVRERIRVLTAQDRPTS